jgi:hypothetical protein
MTQMLYDATESVDKFKAEIRDYLDGEVQMIISKVARSKSDSDIKFSK